MTVALDIEKLAKVVRLMKGGATDGERAAARSRAESMAMSAGLTLDDAMAKLADDNAPPAPGATSSSWDEFFTGMMRERWQDNEPKRAEALKKHRSQTAIFAETERERLLSEAVDGMRWGDDVPQPVRAAVMAAYPMPGNLRDALVEWRSWQDLWELRRLFDTRYEHLPGVAVRWERLEWMLDNWSDPTFDGLIARVTWLNYWEKEGGGRGYGTGEAILALLSDVFMLKADLQPGAAPAGKNCQTADADYPERRTSAQKRAAILEMLRVNPDLSDGEIARRCGVSRQSVSNHRKALRDGGAPQ